MSHGEDLKLFSAKLIVDVIVEKPISSHLTMLHPVLVRTEDGVTVTNGETNTDDQRVALDAMLDKDFDFKRLMPIKTKPFTNGTTAGNIIEYSSRTYDLTKIFKKFIKTHVNNLDKEVTQIPKFYLVWLMKSGTETVRIRDSLNIDYEPVVAKRQF